MNRIAKSFAAAAIFGHECTPDSSSDKFLKSLEMSLLITPLFRHPSVVLIRKTSDFCRPSLLGTVWSLTAVCTHVQPLSLIERLSSTKVAFQPLNLCLKHHCIYIGLGHTRMLSGGNICHGTHLSRLSSPPHRSIMPITVRRDEGCAVLTGRDTKSVAPTESQLTHGCSCITQLAATHVLLEQIGCVKQSCSCNAGLLLQPCTAFPSKIWPLLRMGSMLARAVNAV